MKGDLKTQEHGLFKIWNNKSENNLRILIVICLLGLTFLATYFPYSFFRYLEDRVATEEYDVIVRVVESSFHTGMANKAETLNVMETMFRSTCPSAASWPNCTVSPTIFDDLSDSVTLVSGAANIGFAPIVQPDEVYGFETYVNDVYAAAGAPSIGYWKYPSGKAGILGVDESGALFHDTGPAPHSEFDFLTPIVHYTGVVANSFYAIVLYNMHRALEVARVVDPSVTCALEHPGPSCARISDFLRSEVDSQVRPGAYITNTMVVEDKLAAVLISTHDWDDLIEESFPEYVEGVHVVLSSGTASFTYTFDDGAATVVGEGDQHDRNYDNTRHSFPLHITGAGDVEYRVSLYATNTYYRGFRDESPIYASVIGGAIVVATSLLFFLYDFFLSRTARENEVILATKRAFVRYISHEIRTPLNTVNVGLKVLSQEVGTLAEAGREGLDSFDSSKKALLALVNEIAESSDAAVDVLNDLINYDKICMGTMILETHVVDFCTLVENACAPFMLQAQQSNIKMVLDIEDGLRGGSKDGGVFRVVGDDVKLMQTLRNLLSNAVKFTPSSGSIDITVRRNNSIEHLQVSDEKLCKLGLVCHRAGTLMMKVKDSGAGISLENQNDLFKEGMQFNANKLQGGKGSGLGLFITKGIIEAHGGVISIFSEGEGKGCTFSIELPAVEVNSSVLEISDYSSRDRLDKAKVVDEESAAIEMSTLKQPQPNSELEVFVFRTIFVVDDSSPSRKMVARLLKNCGYHVVEAVDGEKCIDYMVQNASAPESDRVHMILMDYEMPVMNGPLATKALREMGVAVPIIGLTGNVLPVDIELFLDHGANAVLTKPLNLLKFAEILKTLPKDHGLKHTALRVPVASTELCDEAGSNSLLRNKKVFPQSQETGMSRTDLSSA